MANDIYFLRVIKSAEKYSFGVDYLFLKQLSSFLTVSPIHVIYISATLSILHQYHGWHTSQSYPPL